MAEVSIPTLEEVMAALDGATEEQIAAFAGAALKRIKAGGRLPRDVFNPIRERAVMSPVEVVAFEAGSQGQKVLLGQRTDDPKDWWSGQLNLPGSMVFPREVLKPEDLTMSNGQKVDLGNVTVSHDVTSPADRVLADEFKGSVRRTAPVKPLDWYWVQTPRSAEHKIWVVTEAELNPAHEGVWGGNFYDTQEIIANPPENLVVGHAYFIELGYHALRAT